MVDIPITMSDWHMNQWTSHLLDLSQADTSKQKYITKNKFDMDRNIQSTDNLIYSFPATALISNFSDHHLMAVSQGVQFISHPIVNDINSIT